MKSFLQKETKGTKVEASALRSDESQTDSAPKPRVDPRQRRSSRGELVSPRERPIGLMFAPKQSEKMKWMPRAPDAARLALSYVMSPASWLFFTLLCLGWQIPLFAGEHPRHTNVLRLARTTDPTTLDPAMVLSTTDWAFVGLLSQSLLDVDHGTNLFAYAAKSWTASPDARTFTFQLRTNVKFSDGRPVTASDYVYSIKRIADPRSGSWQQIYCTGIRGYDDFLAGRTNELVGLRSAAPDLLIVELTKSDPVFPILISGFGCAVPREHVEKLGPRFREAPVSCGPYRVREWRRGLEVVLEQNPFYSGPVSNRFDRIEIMIGGDESTHLMMFERGEIDVVNLENGVPLPDFIRLLKNPRTKSSFEFFPGFNVTYIVINTEVPPLNNLMVRQALNYAVDKPRRMLAGAHQFSPAQGIIPPSVPGYNPGVRGYSFDPAKARALLKSSGLPLPLRIELWHRPSLFDRMVCGGIQADLRAVGVEIELKEATDGALASLTRIRGRIQMSLSNWNPNPDPRDFIATMFDGRALASPDTMNTSFYNNSEVNRLIDQASELADMPMRFALFQKAEQIIVADAPWIFLGHKIHCLLRKPGLKGDILDPFGIYRFDRGWFE